MNQRTGWIVGVFLAALACSCQASYSRTEKEEVKEDGTKSKETETEISGAVFPNGGTLKTDGKSVEVTAGRPNGSTTTTPEPGEEVPIPQGTTSVETKETQEPKYCPACGNPMPRAIASKLAFVHPHADYHRFERYVPYGEWEAFMFAEDSSPFVSGVQAARDLWRALVTSLSAGIAPPTSTPSELGDVRFYGMRVWSQAEQLYVSFADRLPFESVSLALREVGTGNGVTLSLLTPGASQTIENGWYVANIPVDWKPDNLVDPEVELEPVLQNVGVAHTKGYVRTYGWE